MKPESKKRTINLGLSLIGLGAFAWLVNHESLWLTVALVLIGSALIVQALVMGKKPRA